jgi:hypothetical protein
MHIKQDRSSDWTDEHTECALHGRSMPGERPLGGFNYREGLIAVLKRIPEEHWHEAFERAKRAIAAEEHHDALRERVAKMSDADLEKLLERAEG